MANIATTDVKEAPLSVAVGGGRSVPITETASQVLGGTTGSTDYAFKVARSVATMASGDESTPSGSTLAIIPIDGEFADPTLVSLKSKFMFYRVKNVTLILKCISPWSTASGTAQVAYNLDPENLIASGVTGNEKRLEQSVRFMRSQQVSAKTDLVTQIPDEELNNLVTPGSWRWCKPGASAYARLERYGDLMIVVRGAPVLGEGSSWAITVEGMVQFSHPTVQSDSTTMRSSKYIDFQRQLPMVLERDGPALNLIITSTIGAATKNTAGTVNVAEPMNPITLYVKQAGGPDEPHEKYTLTLQAGTYVAAGNGDTTMVFKTLIGTTTQFSDPVLDDELSKRISNTFLYYWNVPNTNFDLQFTSITMADYLRIREGDTPQPAIMYRTEAIQHRVSRFIRDNASLAYVQVGNALRQL